MSGDYMRSAPVASRTRWTDRKPSLLRNRFLSPETEAFLRDLRNGLFLFALSAPFLGFLMIEAVVR